MCAGAREAAAQQRRGDGEREGEAAVERRVEPLEGPIATGRTGLVQAGDVWAARAPAEGRARWHQGPGVVPTSRADRSSRPGCR